MKQIALLLLLGALLGATSAKHIVCYYSSWAIYYGSSVAVQPEDIDANMCTHINYAFIAVNEDGSLKVEDEYADIDQGLFYRVTDLKQKNPNLKVLLSVGGASAPSQVFSRIVADPGKRAAMVGSARWFLETYNFDGIDLDWETPGGGDKSNYIALLQDFRNDFDRNGWLLTAAVMSDPSEGYDVPRMSELLDYICVMTYDMYGPWSEYTGQNSPLWAASIESQWEKENLNIDACIRKWTNKGANPTKLLPGVAFYGRTFTLRDRNNNGLHAPINGPGHGGPVTGEEGGQSYIEFCMNNNWGCNWDGEQKSLICLDGDQWIGIDDEGSIRNIVAYINSNNLAGAMIWSIDQDDIFGRCGAARPLIRAIYDNLN